ncbi:MAG: preprotein translocase subunit Sec61beta [Candidatus Aenigmarchaeota archaeon]|nr:preprotein translocase subunit Sec61beta [Candidatus Aenigmarchaeota archaeon]
MARRERLYLPMGAGGLLRYPEEEKEVIKIKPEHVVYLVIAIIILEMILKVFFPL